MTLNLGHIFYNGLLLMENSKYEWEAGFKESMSILVLTIWLWAALKKKLRIQARAPERDYR